MAGYKKISGKASITQIPQCPVQILDCSVLSDKRTGEQLLQVQLQNDSGRVLAAVVLLISCYDRDGNLVSRQERSFYTHQNLSQGICDLPPSAGGLQLPGGPAARVSVRVKRVLAFKSGDRGEVVDIT